ncbi:hypothetical protein F4775DRAFT_595294 [Biscogniauxia sp. FL1348]|nr:hypothetical protein F4775DRAFT_595294 [Biscogniauxia sp. FL1348]
MAAVFTNSSSAVFLAPLHFLSFSTLLGTELYQSFVVTGVCFSSLPRPAFVSLQKRLFPAYFRIQSLFLLLTAVTIPPYGPLSLVARKGAWIPLLVAGATALLNLVIYGPRTSQLMLERAHRETNDNKPDTGDDDPEDVEARSAEMQRLKRSFSRSHAMSIHLNLVTIVATVWWGWKLGSLLDFKMG